MLDSLVQKTKWVLPLLVANVGNVCFAAPISNWQTQSIVSIKYEKVGEEIGNKEEQRIKYVLSADVSENILNVHVRKELYDVVYDILKPTNIERQQEYKHKISENSSLTSGVMVAGGLVIMGLGSIFRLNTGTFFEYNPEASCGTFPNQFLDGFTGRDLYYNYNPEDEQYEQEKQDWYGCYAGYAKIVNTETALLTTGAIVAGIGITIPIVSKKKERPTHNYREIEVPLDTSVRRERELILANTIPGVHVPVTFTSEYFTIHSQRQGTMYTQSDGSATVELEASDPNFVFSLGDLVNTDIARQLHEAGYANPSFIGFLQEVAVPVTYNPAINISIATEENVTATVPVKGYIVNQKGLEKVIMKL